MSTDKANIVQQRFAILARLGEGIFHAHDLANLWGIKNSNTLYTTLKRYTQAGLLFRIYKGFYSIQPIEKNDSFILGLKAVHRYAYVSTESILFNAGIIHQKNHAITLVSSLSLKFKIGNILYISRQLTDRFLFNSTGVVNKNNILMASTERAIADMLYFNPKMHFDPNNLINWQVVGNIQKSVGYKPIEKNGV